MIKRRKTTGEKKELYRVLSKDNESSSKLRCLDLLKMSGEQFTSKKGVGPS